MTIDNRLDFCEECYESLFSDDMINYGNIYSFLSVSLTIDSTAPPIHGANGVLNLDSIPSSLNVLVVFCWFSLFNALYFHVQLPQSLEPLLLLIKRGFPRREVDRRNARRKLSVEEVPARSM